MITEHPHVPNARTLSDAEYQAAKNDIIRRLNHTRQQQRDTSDLARITARHAPKAEK